MNQAMPMFLPDSEMQTTRLSPVQEPVFSAKDLSVTYASSRGVVKALDGFNATLGKGQFLSILGPSGCGKSTLLKVVSGLLQPSGGSITLDGKPITGPRPDVGIVFQQPTLLPWKSVIENVLLPVRALGLDVQQGTERAHELLKLVGLSKYAKHYPHELSGGMQQRVGIARGLVHEPSVLLMDEPFAALDAMTREHMTIELQRIWMATGKTVIFITHSIPEAVFLGDRIVVLSAGPGKTVLELDVNIPRARTLDTMREPEFVGHCNDLRELFTKLVKFE